MIRLRNRNILRPVAAVIVILMALTGCVQNTAPEATQPADLDSQDSQGEVTASADADAESPSDEGPAILAYPDCRTSTGTIRTPLGDLNSPFPVRFKAST